MVKLLCVSVLECEGECEGGKFTFTLYAFFIPYLLVIIF